MVKKKIYSAQSSLDIHIIHIQPSLHLLFISLILTREYKTEEEDQTTVYQHKKGEFIRVQGSACAHTNTSS